MEETNPIWPNCEATIIVEICNMKRCQQCGHQFDQPRSPVRVVERYICVQSCHYQIFF